MAMFALCSCPLRLHNESARVPQELSQINRTSTNEPKREQADANRREIAVALHIVLESPGASKERSGIICKQTGSQCHRWHMRQQLHG